MTEVRFATNASLNRNAEGQLITDSTHKTVEELEFIGDVSFAIGFTFEETEFGGLSGITYNPFNRVYYAISDDRSQRNDARFYTLNINLEDNSLATGDVVISDVTTLLNEAENPFLTNGIDAEGIAFTSGGSLFISSEGNTSTLLDPFVNQFSLDGQEFQKLPIPNKFLPTANGSSGIRNNLAFESLTITPDERYLYTAVESALIQDGTTSTLEDQSAVRILQYDLETEQPIGEFLYFTDPIPQDSNPPGGFADNGLVELIALDNTGTFLALERSFASGVGNNIRLYEVYLQGATDISNFDSLAVDRNNPNQELYEVDAVAKKELLIDFAQLGIPLDNIEGMTLGPVLPDGRQSLVLVSDNNFSSTQTTQFLAFALKIESIPSVTPTVETPSEIRYGDPNNPDPNNIPDADDPAIYVNPTDSAQSLVIGTLKDGGLAVYDLNGEEVQKISPESVRYNNVDLIYGFNLGEETVDLAVASDRANDTLAIYQIDSTTSQLTDITDPNISPTIFGIDDGEQTAYGLTTYTSPVSGKDYVFVSQREGNQIAQLELIDNGSGQVTAEIVRIFEVLIPPDGELEDAQIEGMVVDQELGYLYVGQEQFGIWKFAAEPNDNNTETIVDTVTEVNPNGNLEADAEGLTIYYGEDGQGYLLASSQGDSTFAIYERQGSNSFLGSFVVGGSNGIDGVEESDGAAIINVPLGDEFSQGLLVVHDGSNEPQVVFQDPDEGEIQNFNTNFKYIDLADLSTTLPIFDLDTDGYDPRNREANSLVNGIASGDTTQDSTVLWALSTFLGEVTFEYSTDLNFNAIAGTTTATVTDSNLPVKVEINDLTPNTTYYYRVTDVAGDTKIGTFQTAASLGTNAGLDFGVSGDWRGELAPYPAISNVAEKNLDFFVEHGDTIYADYPSDAVKNPDGTRKEQVKTLDEYRAKHSEVYSDRFGVNSWEELRASTSILATIDDHEVINDFSGGATASSDPRFGESTGLINDTQLYENGLQAFQEYNPIRDEFYGNTGDERTAGERKLYRYNTYGSDAATYVIDTRSFRDEPLETANLSDPADVRRFLVESLTSDRTLLGDVQLADLKRDLLQAEADEITWKFIMIPEPIQNLGPGLAEDRYEGYANERSEILKFIDDNNIDNVVFIAADIHGTVVNNLTYQEIPNGPQIATNAFEITTGSVAFDPPFGPAVIGLAASSGLLSPEEKAFYDALPVANDPDSIANDKDDFLKQVINQGLQPFGYDPVGLNDNLAIANGLIDATLIQGDYLATQTFGWTEFQIDSVTQQLRVITYGIEPYTEAELLANPDAILNRTPQIVSEFVVNPSFEASPPPRVVFGTERGDTFDTVDPESEFKGDNQILFTGSGEDTVDVSLVRGNNRIDLGSGNDIVFAGTNNRILAGSGDDIIFAGTGGGDNVITGGSGADQFWLVTDADDLPLETNIITDFETSQGDVMGFANTNLNFDSLTLVQEGNDTLIQAFERDVAKLLDTQANSLVEANFVFA